LKDATKTEIIAEWNKVSKIVKANSDKNYMIISLYAGHGQIYESKQVVLCNEYDKAMEFYGMY